MEYDFRYKSLLSEHGITEQELPDDARALTKQIKQILQGISMQEAKGRGASVDAISRLKSLDKALANEIIDFVQEKKSGGNNGTKSKEELEAERKLEEEAKKKQEAEDAEAQAAAKEKNKPVKNEKGFSIEKELKSLADGGIEKISLQDLKQKAPTTYEEIYEGYEPSGKNGITTSNYSLLETEKENFTLTKK